jgi:hypothetical protein
MTCWHLAVRYRGNALRLVAGDRLLSRGRSGVSTRSADVVHATAALAGTAERFAVSRKWRSRYRWSLTSPLHLRCAGRTRLLLFSDGGHATEAQTIDQILAWFDGGNSAPDVVHVAGA